MVLILLLRVLRAFGTGEGGCVEVSVSDPFPAYVNLHPKSAPCCTWHVFEPRAALSHRLRTYGAGKLQLDSTYYPPQARQDFWRRYSSRHVLVSPLLHYRG